MRNHNQAALMLTEEFAQPGNRIRIEVVRRLVEKQRRGGLARAFGSGEENLRKLDAAALTTRKRLQRLVEYALRQAQRVANAGCLGVRLVAAEVVVALLETRKLPNRRIALRVSGRGLHDLLLAIHAAADLVKATRRQHTVAGGDVDVALARVLWQVTNRARAHY